MLMPLIDVIGEQVMERATGAVEVVSNHVGTFAETTASRMLRETLGPFADPVEDAGQWAMGAVNRLSSNDQLLDAQARVGQSSSTQSSTTTSNGATHNATYNITASNPRQALRDTTLHDWRNQAHIHSGGRR